VQAHDDDAPLPGLSFCDALAIDSNTSLVPCSLWVFINPTQLHKIKLNGNGEELQRLEIEPLDSFGLLHQVSVYVVQEQTTMTL
jgi:hypothetical protein